MTENLKPYHLRNSTASFLEPANVNPKVVSERLGHPMIVLTLDFYSQVLPTMQESATEHLEEYVFSAKQAVDKLFGTQRDIL